MKTVTARLSIFDSGFRPVQSPAEFIASARKRLGKPIIARHGDSRIYQWFHGGFDKLTVKITS